VGTRTAFLSYVVDFVERETELLAAAYDDHRYFADCVARANDREECVVLRELSFLRDAGDGRVERVNDVLSRSEIRIEFRFIDGERITDDWGAFLNQMNLKLTVQGVDLPAVLKWELTDDGTGRLKQDEWTNTGGGAYIERAVTPRRAIELGVTELLFDAVPRFEDRSNAGELAPLEYKIRYNDDHGILDQLDPYDHPD
jgi:hypothetical protein